MQCRYAYLRKAHNRTHPERLNCQPGIYGKRNSQLIAPFSMCVPPTFYQKITTNSTRQLFSVLPFQPSSARIRSRRRVRTEKAKSVGYSVVNVTTSIDSQGILVDIAWPIRIRQPARYTPYVMAAFRSISAACSRVAAVILMPPSMRAISSTRALSVSRVIEVVATPSAAVLAT